MVDFRALLDKNFKGESIKGSPPLRLTVKTLKAAEVGLDKQAKPVLYFLEDPRGVVLNNKKFNALASANGEPGDGQRWAGTVVELTFDPDVVFQGQKCGGIALKVITPAAKTK